MHPVERFASLADLLDQFTARAHGMVWSMTPFRVEVTSWPHGTRVWRRADG